ncbi:hypothetical protein [Subtercola frigoramans]|uniref:Uncharacterized protein n=1 Tax=Subtercola frigoramans TaxID=120298 RepID=A0ABS2L487_9MICO|nr:hypothetical protein [Subtercola frigoramans]MBM7471711.1 hypothetical protein [Subtercola frigoramans]
MTGPANKYPAREVGSSLIDFVEASFALCKDILLAPPSPGTEAEKQLGAQSSLAGQWAGSAPVREAQYSAIMAIVAGLDHADVFAHALHDDIGSLALATVQRGALESFARAHWMLTAANETELVLRWASMTLSEIEIHMRHYDGAQFYVNGKLATGESIAAMVGRYIQSLTERGKRADYKPTLIAQEYGSLLGPDGVQVYSRLSAIAHAQSFGIGQMLTSTKTETGGTLEIVLSDRDAREYAEGVFSMTLTIIDELCVYYGCSPALHDPWVAQHARTLDTITRAQQRPPSSPRRSQ